MPMPVNNIRRIFLTPLPLIVLAVSVCVVIWFVNQSKVLPTGTRLSVHHALQNIPEKDIEKHLSKLIPKTVFTGRDPFFRSSVPQIIEPLPISEDTQTNIDLKEIQLTTIAHGKVGSYCLINGRIYHEGRKGDGFNVDSIFPDRVILSTPSQTFTLKPGTKITLEGGKILSPATSYKN